MDHITLYINLHNLQRLYSISDHTAQSLIKDWYGFTPSGFRLDHFLKEAPRRPKIIQEMLRQGLSQTEIANTLKITQPSVNYHVSKIKQTAPDYLKKPVYYINQYFKIIQERNTTISDQTSLIQKANL